MQAFFSFGRDELKVIARRRGDNHKLGLTLHSRLCTHERPTAHQRSSTRVQDLLLAELSTSPSLLLPSLAGQPRSHLNSSSKLTADLGETSIAPQLDGWRPLIRTLFSSPSHSAYSVVSDAGAEESMADALESGSRAHPVPIVSHEGLSGEWVLTLALAEPSRLLAILGDGRWRCSIGEAPWPPDRASALPAVIHSALSQSGEARLSIQLAVELDGWAWEDEIASATGHPRSIPRHFTNLADTSPSSVLLTRLVIWEDASVDLLQAIRAARKLGRPVVVAGSEVPVAQRPQLESLLRTHWRDPLLLSQSLERSLHALGLPPQCCRLYGDGPGLVDEAEQGWRPVTAVSIDLVGSTPLLNATRGERYGETMRSYYQLCQDITQRFHGTLDLPQGDDDLMAYFGFPRAIEGAANRALTAAWHLSHELAQIGLLVRIGVASGEVAVNSNLAYGSDVHLAARIRAKADPGQVLVAPSTLQRVSLGFSFALEREDQKLEGFDFPTSLYALKGLPPQWVDGDAVSRPSTRFIGRRTELELLRRAWHAARPGRVDWFIVRGEAGVGKSRLLQEFSRTVEAEGQRCYQVTGQALTDRSPFAAVVDALRRLWRVVPGYEASSLARLLTEVLPYEQQDDPAVAELVRLLLPSGSGMTSPEPEERRRGANLLLECLLALLSAGPCCLVVDDAHWLDPSSIELLRRLSQIRMPQPLLVVLCERSGSAPLMALPGAKTMDLQGLNVDEAEELAEELGAQLPQWARKRVIGRTEGVPLFLEESIRMLCERGVQTIDTMPAKLEYLLAARLDELGLDRAFAQLISLLGREFPAAHLEALLQEEDPFIAAARQHGSLEYLLDTGLLQRLKGPPSGYRFRHELIRDTAYKSMLSRDRERLHGLCAGIIERVTPELRRDRPELLADHLEKAGRTDQALSAWFDAAQLAAARQAHRETVALSQRALALLAAMPGEIEANRLATALHLLVASARIALHGYASEQVEQAYLAASTTAARGADEPRRLRIQLGLEAFHVMRGNLRQAGKIAEDAAAATGWDGDPRLALQARWALANVQFHRGQWRVALAGFEECLSHYHPGLHRRSSVQDPAIMCMGYSSWILFEIGQANEALRRIERMLLLAQELDHPFSTSVALAFAASLKRLCGDGEGAWPHAVDAVKVCERGGFEVWLAHAWMVRGQLLSDRGEVQRGAEDMERGYALWTAGGARISCATYLITRAEILLRQGETAAAARQLAQAIYVSKEIREAYYSAELRRLQGLCAWQMGDVSRARETLQRALALARRHAKPGLVLRCALSLGALEAAAGQTQAAAQRVRAVIERLPGHDRCRDARWARQALKAWDAGQAFAAHSLSCWEPA